MAPRGPRLRRVLASWASAVFLLACVVYAAHARLYGAWINDDAGTSFTYARNLAGGHGLVLNAGGERVEGYSNPLWVLLLAAFFLLGLFDPVLTPKILAGALTVGTFWLTSRISRRLGGAGESPLHAMPSLLLAANVSFVSWSMSGLENALLVFLLTAAVHLGSLEAEDPARRPWSALALFLLSITRPEGILYAAPFLAHRLQARMRARTLGRRDLLWLLLLVVPLLLYHVWHYLYFADLLPNTYHAKMPDEGSGGRLRRQLLNFESSGWRYVREGLGRYRLDWLPALCLLGAAWPLRRRLADLALLAGCLATTVFCAVYVGGDWMGEYRFLSAFYAPAYVAVAAALGALEGAVERSAPAGPWGLRLRGAAIHLVPGLVAGWLAWPSAEIVSAAERTPSVPFEAVARRGRTFGRLAAEWGLERASLLDPDLGGTSFGSGLEVIDLGGLADVHIARHGYDPRFFPRYVFEERRPTFIRTHGVWSRDSRVNEYPEARRDYLPLWERPSVVTGRPGILDGEYVRKDVVVSRASAEGLAHADVLGGEIALLGFEADPPVVAPGRGILATTRWATAGLVGGDADYRVLPALIGPGGARIEAEIRPLGHGVYPPGRWQADEVIRHVSRFSVPEAALEGDYRFQITLLGSGSEASRTLGVVRVSAGEAAALASAGAARAHQQFEEALASGDLRRARAFLAEAVRWESRAPAPDAARRLAAEGRLRAAEREEASRLVQEGRRLLEGPDAFLRWGEAFTAFQDALALDPSLARARQAVEALRSREYVSRLHGSALRAAHAGSPPAGGLGRILEAILDEGFSGPAMEILDGSEAVRRLLEEEGALGSLALLHRRHFERGEQADLARLDPKIEVAAPRRVRLDDKLVYLGGPTEVLPGGDAKMTWYFKVQGRMRTDYRLFLHGEVKDPSLLPEDTRAYGFANFDHAFERPTTTWRPGEIIRHVHTFRPPPGEYRFTFGLFNSKEATSLKATGTDAPGVDMGWVVLRAPAAAGPSERLGTP